MRKQIFATALLGSLPLATPSMAVPIPAIDVPAMENAADVIVVGRSNGVAISGQLSKNFAISVDRVLKGSAPNLPSPGSVRIDISTPGFQSVVDRQYGVYFLRRAAAGGYVPVDPYHLVVAVSPVRGAGQTSDAAQLAGVANELVQVFVTPPALLMDPVKGVQGPAVWQESPLGPSAGLQQIYYGAASALQSIPFESSGAEIRAAGASASDSARLWLLDCLLFMQESDAVNALKLQYLESVKSILLNPPADMKSTVFIVANSLQGHIHAQNAAAAFAELLGSTDVDVRRAAASVLGDIGSAATLATLAKIGLEDPDRDVRYYSVLGLAAATGSSEAPAKDLFVVAAETATLAYWRGWARANIH